MIRYAMKRCAVWAAIAATALGLGPGVEAQEPDQAEEAFQVAERCATPEHRQFDFWVGLWEVRNPDGQVVGRNEIRRISGGCGLLESWTGAEGGTGMSINTYDADLGRWTQRWVGAGATLWLEGGLEEGPEGRRMVLAGTEPRSTPRGQVLDRIIWTPLPDGRVRQVWKTSSDGGESWDEAFVGLYSRTESKEAAEPPQDGSVVKRTPEELEWREAPTGAAFATVYGAPSEAGPFAFRMRMPPDFRMQPHSHNTAEHVTVLSGILYMRFSPDGEAIELPPGSAISIPADRPMWAWTDQYETIIQVHGTGPFRTNPVEEQGDGG